MYRTLFQNKSFSKEEGLMRAIMSIMFVLMTIFWPTIQAGLTEQDVSTENTSLKTHRPAPVDISVEPSNNQNLLCAYPTTENIATNFEPDNPKALRSYLQTCEQTYHKDERSRIDFACHITNLLFADSTMRTVQRTDIQGYIYCMFNYPFNSHIEIGYKYSTMAQTFFEYITNAPRSDFAPDCEWATIWNQIFYDAQFGAHQWLDELGAPKHE